MSKELLNIRHESGHFKVIYPELLEVGERREITHGAPSELIGAEGVTIMVQADPKSLDQRKEAKFV